MKRALTVFTTGLLVASAVISTNAYASIAGFSQKAVEVNGQLLSDPYAFVASDGSEMTTYMPIWYVGQALQAAGFTQSWNGATHTWTLTTGTQGDFSSLPIGNGSASIVVNGQVVKKLNTYVRTDPAAGKNAAKTVYMPIYYVQQLLTAAGIPSSWDGQTWAITSSSAASKPIIFGFVTNYSGSTSSLTDLEAHSEVSEFATFTHSITASGGLSGTLFTAAGTYAQSHDLSAYVTITDTDASTGDFDGKMAATVLNHATTRSTLIQHMVTLVKGTSFAGINIDFEMLSASERANFTQFLTALQQQLHQAGKKLSVDIPAITSDNTAYDEHAIGQVSDEVMLMAYDYSYPGGPAGAIAPVWWVNDVLAYTTKEISANKLLLGLPVYGYDWANGKTQALSLPQVDQLMAEYSVAPKWDAKDEAPYFNYTKNGVSHTVYYENAQSITDELATVQSYHLRGVAVWRMGLEDTSIWPAIQRFANGSSSS